VIGLDDAIKTAHSNMTDGTRAANERGEAWYPSEEARYLHAQALATIALAEEQRTANLLAFIATSQAGGWSGEAVNEAWRQADERLGLTEPLVETEPTTTSGDGWTRLPQDP
jgi:hypothetical protein